MDKNTLFKLSAKSIAAAAMSAAILGGAIDANAVKAYPRPITYTQPDGSVVTVKTVGDEFNHASYTVDGYMLIATESGTLTYAQLDADGNPVASDIVARDLAFRTASDRAFLASLNSDKIETARQRNAKRTARSQATATRALGDTPKYIFSGTPFPCTGSPRACVILVSYADNDFSMENPQEFYDNMLNGENFTEYKAVGSAREYMRYNSNGLFTPHFDVLGPVKLKSPMSFYGGNDSRGNDKNPQYMAIEACEALDDTVDFSVYDHDGDGMIDNVFVIYAGYGEADSQGRPSTVWPHSMDISDLKLGEKFIFDGVELNRYGCTMEVSGIYRRPDGIGTFVHEFSHVLGLPDLYNTISSYDDTTPGEWNILDSGPYNAEGVAPPNYSAHERYALNWIEPIVLDKDGTYTMEALDKSNTAYIIRTDKPDEFFLLENRQKNNYDASLPNHGMLVWHVDFLQKIWDNNTVNNTKSHHYVDLVCADNRKGSSSYSGDSYPGKSGNTAFGATTSPALKTWTNKVPIGVEITDIKETALGEISFNVITANGSGVETVGIDGIVLNGRTLSASSSARVYNAAGALCGTLDAQRTLTLDAPGLYIIATGDHTAKVMVK